MVVMKLTPCQTKSSKVKFISKGNKPSRVIESVHSWFSGTNVAQLKLIKLSNFSPFFFSSPLLGYMKPESLCITSREKKKVKSFKADSDFVSSPCKFGIRPVPTFFASLFRSYTTRFKQLIVQLAKHHIHSFWMGEWNCLIVN